MRIEIWSDIVCPFCYIGKRRFESALNNFSHSDQITLEWKSFQLNPHTKTDTTINVYQHLATHKGISLSEAEKMSEHVTDMALAEGLKYDFDRAVVANTLRAHQLLHLAKSAGKQDAMKERLLQAYFVEGKNVDDVNTLIKLGVETGLDSSSIKAIFDDSRYLKAVHSDVQEAGQLGIRGVPFFVFNRKYGISGAQSSEVFLQTLEKSFGEWQAENQEPQLSTIQGDSCSTEEGC